MPLAPVQLSVKLLVVVKAPVPWLPESDFGPDHAPDAVQDDTLEDDHTSDVEPPLPTEDGFAENDNAGAVDAVTVTVTERVVLPLLPVQARVNVLVAVSWLMVWLPLGIAFAPDHAPEAEQLVALLDDQVSVVEEPLDTDDGEAPMDTVGAPGPGGGGVDAELLSPVVLPAPPQALSMATMAATPRNRTVSRRGECMPTQRVIMIARVLPTGRVGVTAANAGAPKELHGREQRKQRQYRIEIRAPPQRAAAAGFLAAAGYRYRRRAVVIRNR